MKKFLDSRLRNYLIYWVLFYLTWWLSDFQSAAALFLIYILADINYNYDNISVAISSNNKSLPEPTRELAREPEMESPWIELEKEWPPHEVVLVACDTSDCGWVVDTAWWDEKIFCWRLSGGITEQCAHLTYSHWRKMPKGPDGN